MNYPSGLNMMHLCATGFIPTSLRRKWFYHPFMRTSNQALATDAIGVTTVTFDGVSANSEIRVYFPDGMEAAGVELCTANHQLSWNVFSIGSANNTVTIRVVHPQYKIKEFQYTASLGAQAIPIQQELDKWYSNPA